MIDGNLKTESALERELDDLLCHSLTVNSGPEKEALLEQMKEVFDQLNTDPERTRTRNQIDFEQIQKDYDEDILAISCIELTMKHNIRGDIIEWGLNGKAYSDL